MVLPIEAGTSRLIIFFYSTLCAELKTESQPNQRIIMGDDLLRPFQQQLIADDLAAQAQADDDLDLDADDLADAEDDDDDDDDDGHRYDAYFDIRVKRRMVRLSLFFVFDSILFPLSVVSCSFFLFLFCFHESTIQYTSRV